jgi:hypothetical protein
LETSTRKLRHQWARRFELSSEATGDNWTICKRCGVVLRADGKNKSKPCPGLAKITTRKKRDPKKPKA